ncbi:MAG: hypothetical protein U9R38_04630 [Candidatus Margulisiibacteriota bacterium]|nr:hypothetical protein [Candidatus Margulisiibacteriota bacterium]
MAIYQRPVSSVKLDLGLLGVKGRLITRHRLARMEKGAYRGVIDLVNRLSGQTVVDRLKLDPPGKLSAGTLKDIPLALVAEKFVSGSNVQTLDLRGIEKFWAREGAERAKKQYLGVTAERIEGLFPDPKTLQVGHLLDVLLEERQYFDRLARDPQATVDKVFKAIDHGKEKLGFLNVTVYRPIEDGKWVRTQRTRQWRSSQTLKYDPVKGGGFPETTLKSVIEGDKLIYDVMINDPKTFRREGLVPDFSSIRNDLKQSKGSDRMLFVKLVSSSGEVEGVVQLHNRVSVDEPIDSLPLLPKEPQDARRIKTELLLYFDQAVQAIEAIRNRERLRAAAVFPGQERKDPTGEVYSPLQFHRSSGDPEPYLDLKIEINRSPSLNFEKIEARVVEQLTALAEACGILHMSPAEMREHVIRVSRAEIVRKKEEIVGFGTSRYFDNYVNHKGKKETLTLLWGTMVRPDMRRRGLMIKLNFDLIKAAKEAVQLAITGLFKSIRRLFVPAPITVRTQSVAVLNACSRHFSGVARVGQTPKDRYGHMTKFVAERESWVIDGKNIQRNAYDRMRVDSKGDLIPGLGPNDAYVFSGDFTAWKEFLTWVAIKIIYPAKSWWKRKGGKKKISSII